MIGEKEEKERENQKTDGEKEFERERICNNSLIQNFINMFNQGTLTEGEG